MTEITNNKIKGQQGELLISYILGRIFSTSIIRHSGDQDKGIDLSLQFISPINKRLFDINFQIKTGTSYVIDDNKNWKLRNISINDFEKWKYAITPVVLVWVNDTVSPPSYYWKLITNRSSYARLSISKKSILAPSTLYEVIIKLEKKAKKKTKKITISHLSPKINISLRDFAKSFFKKHLLGKKIINPVLGEVNISWHLWNHLTRNNRKKNHIMYSLELMRIVIDVIKYCNKVYSTRKVTKIIRGNWTTEINLIAFKINPDNPSNENSIFLVVRETIIYPNNWKDDLLMETKIKRHLTLESIYRKEKK